METASFTDLDVEAIFGGGASGVQLELSRADGARMQIRMPSRDGGEAIARVVSAFVGPQP